MKKKEIVKSIRSFNRFYTNLIGVVDRHILNSPYSLTEVRIMYEIYNNLNITARKIKNILQVDEGYLSRTIDKLIRQGLITRKQSEEDRRLYILSLSTKGEKEFLALNNESEKEIAVLINHLSVNETDELAKMMRRITELLEKRR